MHGPPEPEQIPESAEEVQAREGRGAMGVEGYDVLQVHH